MGILRTQLRNQTNLRIDFHVDEGFCPLRGLPAGETRSVKLSRIIKCCHERGSSEWPIRVLVNNEFTDIYIHPYHHLLRMSRIVLKNENTNGSHVLRAEGIKEKSVDRLRLIKALGAIFGSKTSLDKRPPIKIAEADTAWPRNLRVFSDPNPPLVRNENSRQMRELEDPNLPLLRHENNLQLRESEDPNQPLVRHQNNIQPGEFEDPNPPLARHEDNLQLRQAAASGGRNRSPTTSPPQQERTRRRRNGRGVAAAGRNTSESVSNSGENTTTAAMRDPKMLYRLLVLRRWNRESVLNSRKYTTTAVMRDLKMLYRRLVLRRWNKFAYLVLFCLAFTVVASARFYGYLY